MAKIFLKVLVATDMRNKLLEVRDATHDVPVENI